MELRIELCCDFEYREDFQQNYPYRTMGGSARLAPATLVPNAKTVVDHDAAVTR